MKNSIAILFLALGFLIGFSITNIFAQNSTQYAPVVQSTDALITSVSSMIIAIGGIIALLVKAGIIDKKIGSAAVMASDAAVAVRDNRQTIKDLSQNAYEVAKVTSPEAAEAADKKLAPVMNQASIRLDEYTSKVDKFTQLGSKLSKKGETTTSEIKEDANLKDSIPDEIVE